VHDLRRRVHPGVGPAGADKARRRAERRKRCDKCPGDGALAGLGGESMKTSAVVRKTDPDAPKRPGRGRFESNTPLGRRRDCCPS
jgi:hypothetical protein